MAIEKVASSMVWAVDYDPKTQVLEVAFKRTGVFRYEGVPPSEYRKNDARGVDRLLHEVVHHWRVSGAPAGSVMKTKLHHKKRSRAGARKELLPTQRA